MNHEYCGLDAELSFKLMESWTPDSMATVKINEEAIPVKKMEDKNTCDFDIVEIEDWEENSLHQTTSFFALDSTSAPPVVAPIVEAPVSTVSSPPSTFSCSHNCKDKVFSQITIILSDKLQTCLLQKWSEKTKKRTSTKNERFEHFLSKHQKTKTRRRKNNVKLS
jgi:hypothetical protein